MPSNHEDNGFGPLILQSCISFGIAGHQDYSTSPHESEYRETVAFDAQSTHVAESRLLKDAYIFRTSVTGLKRLHGKCFFASAWVVLRTAVIISNVEISILCSQSTTCGEWSEADVVRTEGRKSS